MTKNIFRFQNLDKLISNSGKTKATIANEMGISPQWFGDIVHYRKPLSPDKIVPFCKAVDCTPNDLFEWTKEKNMVQTTETTAIPNNIATSASSCPYELPCGICTKLRMDCPKRWMKWETNWWQNQPTCGTDPATMKGTQCDV